MAYTAEGTIEIDLADFFQWVSKNYSPQTGPGVHFGVPRVNLSNQTIEMDFAMGDETDPKTWAKKPIAVTQWDTLQ